MKTQQFQWTVTTGQNWFMKNWSPEEIKAIINPDKKWATNELSLLGDYFSFCVTNNIPQKLSFNDTTSLQVTSLICLQQHESSLHPTVQLTLHQVVCEHICRQHNISQAYAILKNANQYLHTYQTCPVLLSIALSNLATLYQVKNKLHRALNSAIFAIQIIEKHIRALKKMTNSTKKIMQDAVILVNGFLIAHRVLLKLERVNNKTYYRQLNKLISQIGYKYSVKYLGAESRLTKKLKLQENGVLLPVFYQPQKEKQNNEQVIFDKLKQIYEAVNQKPKVVYVPKPKPRPKTPQHRPTRETAGQHLINGWKVIINIVSYDQPQTTNKFNQWKSFVFKCIKNQKQINSIITGDALAKVIRQINFEDTLPYEYNVTSLTDMQFINYCIVPFCEVVQEEGNLQLHPKSLGIIEPFKMQICNRLCVIGVNHICWNHLRVWIGTQEMASCLYVDLEICQISLQKYISVQQPTVSCINKIYQQLAYCARQTHKYFEFPAEKSCRVLNTSQFIIYIKKILRDFQSFIQEYQQSDTVTLQQVILQNPYNYYKFIEIDDSHGCYYYIHYEPQINVINVFLQNNFFSYGPNCRLKAKGESLYEPRQFLKDFGIELNPTLLMFSIGFIFLDMILRKFDLRIFQSQLHDAEQQIYFQNAVIQYQFATGAFIRKIVLYHNYPLAITIGTSDGTQSHDL